jgi:hypothetical protein
VLLAVLREGRECSMLLSGACVSAAEVRECFMLMSGVCVSAARCTVFRDVRESFMLLLGGGERCSQPSEAFVSVPFHATIRSMTFETKHACNTVL